MRHRGRHSTLVVGAAAIASIALQASGQDCGPKWEPPFAVDPALYPFEHQCVRTSDGVIHYVDEVATPEPRGTVLLVHGNPSWSFLYRNVAIDLRAEGFRVIAPDLLGFGMSSKPNPAVFTYSARSQAKNLAEFIAALDLRDVTLVIHDWGGPIGLHAAGVEPDRIASLVVLNTWSWKLREEDRPYFHFLFDWVAYNVQNTGELLRTGSLPKSVGQSVARNYGRPGSPEYVAVRDAYWGPFLDVTSGQPLSEDAIQATNRLYHHVSSDPQFMEEVELVMTEMVQKPVAFVLTSDDKWFGALRCDANGVPPCPPPLRCERSGEVDWCVDNQGQRVFPALERWISLWPPELVRLIDLREGGGHFTAEYEHDAIVDAAMLLNPIADAVELRRK